MLHMVKVRFPIVRDLGLPSENQRVMSRIFMQVMLDRMCWIAQWNRCFATQDIEVVPKKIEDVIDSRWAEAP